ncbi:MAG: 4-hydroxy-tetrahydrodipicolinate synthase [Candidatus Limnocylindria bacterium]
MTTYPARIPIRASRTRLRGAFTALVTPFSADGALDEAAFGRLLDAQVAAGISGLVPCGTTGESPTLSADERHRVIELTVAAARDAGDPRPTVLAGTGTNDTAATIAATRRAAELGADAALVVAPYYNRPNQAMLAAHYAAVADEGGLPVVVYNVPSRTASNVEAATLLELAAHPRIVGVKEASGNLDQIALICRDRPEGFAVLAGDDAWTLPMLALGADGVISVASNEVPADMVALCAAAEAGAWTTAREIHERLLPLFRANFAGAPNPAPVKAALATMGLIENHLRLPLLALDEVGVGAMATALREAGVLAPRSLATSRA